MKMPLPKANFKHTSTNKQPRIHKLPYYIKRWEGKHNRCNVVIDEVVCDDPSKSHFIIQRYTAHRGFSEPVRVMRVDAPKKLEAALDYIITVPFGRDDKWCYDLDGRCYRSIFNLEVKEFHH